MERTLDECLFLFEGGDSTSKYIACKGMEKISEWEQAAIHWRKMGRKGDADACQMIADAIKRGDELRAARG